MKGRLLCDAIYHSSAQPYGTFNETKTTPTGSTVYRDMIRRCNYNGQLADVGTRKILELSDKHPLKQMGIDKVYITKFKNEPRVIDFGYPLGKEGGWQHIAFEAGSKRMKDFLSMLKDCKRINLKPNFDLIRIALRYIK